MNQSTSDKIRMSKKWHPVILNSLMALILSIIISAAMTWMQMGFTDQYWSAFLRATVQSFIVALPSAYIVSTIIQNILDKYIDFY